jgi:hypothetical protein
MGKNTALNRLGLTVPPSVRARADEVIEYGDAMSAFGCKADMAISERHVCF